MTTQDRMIAGLHCIVDSQSGGRVPLVLLHGVGDSAHAWDSVLEYLPADDRTVVRYDLRGHGQSPGPEGPWTIDDFVDDHVRLMSALEIPAADVVGFSLGGLIAQRIAATHPRLVRRLALVGAVAGRTEAERRAVVERLSLVEREGPLGAARQSVDRWYSAGFLREHPEVRERTIELMSSVDPASYTHAYRVLATTDLVADLRKIIAPTLAMTGEHDVGSPPRMSRTIAEGVRSGRWTVIPGARHSVLVEQPERVAKELLTLSVDNRFDLSPEAMDIRREVLGDEYVDSSTAPSDLLTQEFQAFVTNYCWGEIWTDDRLSRAEHSLLVMALTAALGRTRELEIHARGALRNGLTPDQLTAVLRQIAVYAGVPAAVSALPSFRSAISDYERGDLT